MKKLIMLSALCFAVNAEVTAEVEVDIDLASEQEGLKQLHMLNRLYLNAVKNCDIDECKRIAEEQHGVIVLSQRNLNDLQKCLNIAEFIELLNDSHQIGLKIRSKNAQ